MSPSVAAGDLDVVAGFTISGCVKDQDGAALAGVTVTSLPSTTTEPVFTDAAGCYEFASAEPGQYILAARAAGYRVSVGTADD